MPSSYASALFRALQQLAGPDEESAPMPRELPYEMPEEAKGLEGRDKLRAIEEFLDYKNNKERDAMKNWEQGYEALSPEIKDKLEPMSDMPGGVEQYKMSPEEQRKFDEMVRQRKGSKAKRKWGMEGEFK